MLDIVTGEDAPVLRKKAERIKDPASDEIRSLIPEMIETMRKSDGVGLAAPQINRSIRLFVIEVNGAVSVFMNPAVVGRSEESIVFEEGCLSLPGKFLPIERSERITLSYDDIHGKRRELQADGFLAIVIQHEMDHLDGTLITDRYEHQNTKNAYAL